MSTRDPRIEPMVGDIVIAHIGRAYVTRTVRAVHDVGTPYCMVDYDASNRAHHCACFLRAWRTWCRENQASVSAPVEIRRALHA